MGKLRTKQLVVCVNNEGYPASLEKRKIYVALRDAAAEKHGLLRIHSYASRMKAMPALALKPPRGPGIRAGARTLCE